MRLGWFDLFFDRFFIEGVGELISEVILVKLFRLARNDVAVVAFVLGKNEVEQFLSDSVCFLKDVPAALPYRIRVRLELFVLVIVVQFTLLLNAVID